MLFQGVNESCQTKSHFKSTLRKKLTLPSTFHLLITPWIRDQSGRSLGVLEINGFCGYPNPQSPLECNSLGKNSLPDFLPPTYPSDTEDGDYSASGLHDAITWALNILVI